MDRLFIDTGAFVARFLSKDNLHKEAVKRWLKIEKSGIQCITTNAIISETATLIARRGDPVFSARKIRTIYASPRFQIRRSSEESELKAVDLMEKYADLPLSYVDALSVIMMRDQGIKTLFSFDADFSVLKFNLFR